MKNPIELKLKGIEKFLRETNGSPMDKIMIKLSDEFAEKAHKAGFTGGIKIETIDAPKMFCRKCGAGMIESDEPAEEYGFEAYDWKTGKKNFVKRHTCPNHKHNLFGKCNGHSSRFIREAFTK